MWAWLSTALNLRVRITVGPNSVHVMNERDGRVSLQKAPFSCSHLLISDTDIFEECVARGIRAAMGTGWLLPHATVKVEGRRIHETEACAIRDFVGYAGASSVKLVDGTAYCEEQSEAQRKFVEDHNAKR